MTGRSAAKRTENTMSDTAAIHQKAVQLAKLCLRMTAKAGSGHPSSALSLAHIVAELMYARMRFDLNDPRNPGADRLVLSEGHAVPIIYAAYADLGGQVVDQGDARPLTIADLDSLRKLNSPLDGHPNPGEGFPFFDAATGSLGMGLSVAAGLALAARHDGIDKRIYCVIGDGESREGQIWEAADFIVDHKLANVCAVFNCNAYGQADSVSPQQSADTLASKLAAFGWDVATIDGHDSQQVADAFDRIGAGDNPLAIVAKTVKGWGVDKLLNGNWHGKPLTMDDLAEANASLDNRTEGGGSSAKLDGPRMPAAAEPVRVDIAAVKWPSFEQSMKDGDCGGGLEKGKLATRKVYGAALRTAGDVIPQLCVLDGDVSNSTFTNIFAKSHPARFYECKIAEQNLISTAVGLAAAGMLPVANTFAKFFARAYDQIELASVSRANVKLVGSHAGISPCADGPSQMALSDVGYFRTFGTVRGDDRKTPLCWLLQPADAVATYALTKKMLAADGLCYMRTYRPDVPLMYAPDTKFELGGHCILSPGDDLALISCGYALQATRQAAELLAKQGIRPAVVDAYCLPVDADKLLETLRRCGRHALVVEDNYGGGLGAAVAELAAAEGDDLLVQSLHVQRIPKSTRTPEEEFEYCGVAPGQIADHALAMLRQPA
jgi:transketolase